MNIVIIKENLKNGLDAVSRVSTQKESLPILRNVLIRAEKESIVLIATNLEIAITYTIPGKIIEHGSFTVPAQFLFQLIATIPQERLNLFVKDSFLEIMAENYHARIQGTPAEDFPIIPKVKNAAEYFVFSGDIIKHALEKVVVASQYSELRPELNSVLCTFSLDIITFVATDSFRLAEKKLTEQYFTSNYKKEFQFLIPLKTAHEVIKIISEKDEIKIFHDENQVLFSGGTWMFISRLVDGVFPDYQSVIPKEFDAKIIIRKDEFINAIKATSVFGARTQEIHILHGKQKNVIEIFSHDDVLGENTYLVPAKVEGELKNTSFNWKYLIDGIRMCEGEEILFKINSENRPAIVSSPKDTSFFYLVMPIVKR